MSEMRLFNRWTVKKKHFWLGIGLGIPVLCVVTFLVFAFLSPMLGSSSYSMDTTDFGGNFNAGMPAMEEPAYDTSADMADYEGETSLASQGVTDEAIASSNGAVVARCVAPAAHMNDSATLASARRAMWAGIG